MMTIKIIYIKEHLIIIKIILRNVKRKSKNSQGINKKHIKMSLLMNKGLSKIMLKNIIITNMMSKLTIE